MIKYRLICFCFLLSSMFGFAQTTNVTATVTDSDGTAWVYATYTATLFNPSGTKPVIKKTGQPVTTRYTGTIDSTGALSLSLTQNSVIDPSGTQWQFTICSATSAACSVVNPLPINGTNQNISSYLTANITPPRIAAVGGNTRAYGVNEITADSITQGASFFNTSNGSMNYYIGTGWSNGPLPAGCTSGSPGNLTCANITAGTVTGGTVTTSNLSTIRIIDGTHFTKDSAGINAAIAEVSPGGGQVIIPAGTYPISSTISIPPNVSLRGAGKYTTILQASGGVSPIVLVPGINVNGGIYMGGPIEDFSIDATGSKVGMRVVSTQRDYKNINIRHAKSTCMDVSAAQNNTFIGVDYEFCGAAADATPSTYTLNGVYNAAPATGTYSFTSATFAAAPVLTLTQCNAAVNNLTTCTTTTNISSLCPNLITGFPFTITGFGVDANGLTSGNNGLLWATACTVGSPSTVTFANPQGWTQNGTATATGMRSTMYTTSDANWATDVGHGYMTRADTINFAGSAFGSTNGKRRIIKSDSTHVWTDNSGSNETAAITGTVVGFTTAYYSTDANLAADCAADYLSGFFPKIAGFTIPSNNTDDTVEIKQCVNSGGITYVTLASTTGVAESGGGPYTLTFYGDRAGACERFDQGANGNVVVRGEVNYCAPFHELYHANRMIDFINTGCGDCHLAPGNNLSIATIVERACYSGDNKCPANSQSIALMAFRSGNRNTHQGGGLSVGGINSKIRNIWSSDPDYKFDSVANPGSPPNQNKFTDVLVNAGPATCNGINCSSFADIQHSSIIIGAATVVNGTSSKCIADDYSICYVSPDNLQFNGGPTTGSTTSWSLASNILTLNGTALGGNPGQQFTISGLSETYLLSPVVWTISSTTGTTSLTATSVGFAHVDVATTTEAGTTSRVMFDFRNGYGGTDKTINRMITVVGVPMKYAMPIQLSDQLHPSLVTDTIAPNTTATIIPSAGIITHFIDAAFTQDLTIATPFETYSALDADTLTFLFKQGAGGNHNITWSSGYLFPDQCYLNPAVNSISYYKFTKWGTLWRETGCTQQQITTAVRAGTWSITASTTATVTFSTAMSAAPTSCSVMPTASSATTGQPFPTTLTTTGFTVKVPTSGTISGTYDCVINNAN